MRVIQGDCLEQLKTLPDSSVDSLVTDPPAGISFMGKDWDGDKGGRKQWIAWMTSIMEECMRVLKPGAHGLVWALPRTSHWTATALEDAGFEVRDVCTHIFGQGFPKSLDVSKAIDKAAGAEREHLGFKKSPDGRDYSKEDSAKAGLSAGTSFAVGQSLSKLTVTAPATDAAKKWQGWGTALKPASEHWILVRKPLSEKTVVANVLKWNCGALNIDASRILSDGKRPDTCDACARNQGVSSVSSAGKKTGHAGAGSSTSIAASSVAGHPSEEESTTLLGGPTKTATSDSNTGTTRKKSTSTSLSTAMYGEAQSREATSCTISTKTGLTTDSKTCSTCARPITSDTTRTGATGRFPANLVLSGDAPEVLDEQSGRLKSGARNGIKKARTPEHQSFHERERDTGNNFDSSKGGASRFFYCAKISKSERNAGLDTPSTHPTVKPKKLMAYLIRMVTPPGGTVLDPFMGSGSTGIAAKECGFDFIGIEREPEYVAIAIKRIESAVVNA